jgi:hypothetical protein
VDIEHLDGAELVEHGPRCETWSPISLSRTSFGGR